MTGTPASTNPVVVLDGRTELAFSFDEMLRYSGPGSPAGVALAYQAMRLAFARLDPGGPLERREIEIATAFRGPGARDGFELVTRGLTDGRYVIDLELGRPDRGATLEPFVFRLTYRGSAITLLARSGVVTDEFVSLARKDSRCAEEELRLTGLKREMTVRLLASTPAEVFETV